MRKREVLAEFKKTVKSCLKHVECGFDNYTEKDGYISYAYVPKYNHIRYDDNYDITSINIKEGVHGYTISLLNRDESKRYSPEFSKSLFTDKMSAEEVSSLTQIIRENKIKDFEYEREKVREERRSKLSEYELAQEDIYPLTVIRDRYNGTYSGASYLAFNLESNFVPSEVHGSDIHCSYFWDLIDEGNFVEGKVARDYRDVVKYVGKGATIEDAVVDLYRKMKDGGEKFYNIEC